MSSTEPSPFPPSAPRPPVLSGDPDALQAAIQARRAHLSGTLDELAQRVKPANLAADAKEEAVDRARRAVTDEQGNLLYERVAAVAGAVVAVVVALVVARHRSR
ncbi:DUF3618 domain-containing protein [Aquipuribacter hungaricus]|uniref:DUF3618 domain-containing protein n=1 Tax=Aquipuribacter hungaricus TaxID=545624 RepID=A0ABV7WJK1_9MICO